VQQQQQRPTSSWLWGLVKWDQLPAFPLEAPSVQNSNVGQGASVGMSEKRGWFHVPQPQQAATRRPPVVSIRRPGPAFDRPLPAVYQSDMPVSMAKMIMSRHTFRRPSSRPPPARPATIQIQVQRRPGSPSSTPLLPRTLPNSIVIPTSSSSSLSQPTSPPSRSPSPPSASSSGSSTISRTPSPTSPSSSRSGSRSPSPTSSSPRSPSLEDLLELHSRSPSPSPERGSIV